MTAFFIASIAGLFPRIILPLAAAWKSVHPFDVFFVACLVVAATRRAYRPPDWRLIAAGIALISGAALALVANPSPQGTRSVIALAYSIVVLLSVSHMRLDAMGVSAERTILRPLFIAVAIAWAVFLIENFIGIPVARNRSPMLPAFVHRLGGFTGGNTLILFLCLAAPLVRAPWWILGGVLPSAFATLSRSLSGVGVALVLRLRYATVVPHGVHQAIRLASWSSIAISLFIYAFAGIPVSPAQRSTLAPSLELGGYLTPHVAALRMFASSPLVGVGPARFAERFTAFTTKEERGRLPSQNTEFCDPHSAILGHAAEQGLLGLAALIWLVIEVYRRLAQIRDRQLRSAALAGFTGLLVGGHFVDWLALKGLWFWLGLLVASRQATQGNLPATSP